MYIMLVIGHIRGRATNQRRGYFRSGTVYKEFFDRASLSLFVLAMSSSVTCPRSSTGKVKPVHSSHRNLHFEVWIIRSLWIEACTSKPGLLGVCKSKPVIIEFWNNGSLSFLYLDMVYFGWRRCIIELADLSGYQIVPQRRGDDDRFAESV